MMARSHKLALAASVAFLSSCMFLVAYVVVAGAP